MLNYNNVARECGVSAKVVRSYFDILESTLLGFRIQPWKKSKNRRLIQTEKFYLFDIGISNYLARRTPREGTPEFGKSFEHFILMELKAYQAYINPELEIYYWRTSTGQKVDFILNDKIVALEVKSGKQVHNINLKGLKALQEDSEIKHSIIISQEKYPRKIGSIEILPWELFIERLWAGEFGV